MRFSRTLTCLLVITPSASIGGVLTGGHGALCHRPVLMPPVLREVPGAMRHGEEQPAKHLVHAHMLMNSHRLERK